MIGETLQERDVRVRKEMRSSAADPERRPLKPGEPEGRFLGTPVAFWLSTRERIIAATLIQWLGTNCGFDFLRQALERCGWRLVRKDLP